MEDQYHYLLRIMVIGDSSVGKSSIITRFAKGIYRQSTAPTMGIDYANKDIMKGNKKIRLQIWDTAGQEAYRSIVQITLKTAMCILLVYDCTRLSTFQSLDSWLKYINDCCSDNVVIFLVASKVDLLETEGQVSPDEARRLAEEKKFGFLEVSSKHDINIQQLFDTVTTQMLDKFDSGIIPTEINESFKLRVNKEVMQPQNNADGKDHLVRCSTLGLNPQSTCCN